MSKLLQINEVEKGYRTPEGSHRLVVGIPEFSLDEKEEVALRGESGSGKTTFLNLVAGIVKADAGEIRLRGIRLEALKEADRDRARARHIGYVFQGLNLLQGLTCWENILLAMAFGAGRDLVLAKKLLDRVGMSGQADYYPRQLSMGQQQRVAIARALANRPPLILADEPTANLDRKNARQCLNLMCDICRENDAALLLVSHDRSMLAEFERVREFDELNCAFDGERT